MMYSPATRLLTLLELLQSRPGRTAAELSERLQVEARSVRRYVTMLQDMGIPIVAERGRYGGYRLLPGYKLPPLMLSNDEAIAVTLGLLAADRLGLAGAVPAVEGALAKVERVLPAEVRERVRAVQGSVTLDLAEAAVFPEVQHFLALSEAAHSRRRVRMRYQRPDAAPTERGLTATGWFTTPVAGNGGDARQRSRRPQASSAAAAASSRRRRGVDVGASAYAAVVAASRRRRRSTAATASA